MLISLVFKHLYLLGIHCEKVNKLKMINDSSFLLNLTNKHNKLKLIQILFFLSNHTYANSKAT